MAAAGHDEHGIQAGAPCTWSAPGRRCRTCTPSVPAEVLDPRDPGVLLVARRHPLGAMLGAYNVTRRPGHVPLAVLRDLGLDPGPVVDHVSGSTPVLRDDAVQLAPYAACG